MYVIGYIVSCRLACLKLHEESTIRLKEAASLEKEQLMKKHDSDLDQLQLVTCI